MSETTPDPSLDFLSVGDEDVQRWDKEWCRYLARVEGSRYFTDKTKYTQRDLDIVKRLRGLSRDGLYKAKGPMSELKLWYDAADLEGKKVAEIGCGPSQLGRDLAPLVSEYVGLDYSDLALSIARLVCAANCRFFSLRDKVALRELRSTRDTIVCRHFFIHQNFVNATWVLRLANYLLRVGGVMVSDFYWPDENFNEGLKRGTIHYADSDLQSFPSTMFSFSEDQIMSLVQDAGFRVETDWISSDIPRRHFRLIKVASIP